MSTYDYRNYEIINPYEEGADHNHFGSNRLFMLDPGHGGLIDGDYQTQGKRSPLWEDGTQLYEGVSNRAFASALAKRLNFRGIDCVTLVPEAKDISLAERCRRANEIYARDERAVLCSIHSNAGGGDGYEIYTSPGETESDEIATIYHDAFEEVIPEKDLRTDYSDDDPDKEAEFYVLMHTRCPAVLHELLFMDNEEECKNWLMNMDGRTRLTDFLEEGTKEVDNAVL